MDLLNVLLEVAILRNCDEPVKIEPARFVKNLFLNSHVIV